MKLKHLSISGKAEFILLAILFIVLLYSGFRCSAPFETKNTQAHWIGPEKQEFSRESANLQETSWIWASAQLSNAAVHDKETPVYFRKHFEMPKGAVLDNAIISITADDAYTLYLNGKLVGENDQWWDVNEFDIGNFLKDGNNLISVHALNLPVYHTTRRGPGTSPASLIANIKVVFNDGNSFTLQTDQSWKCTRNVEKGWETIEYNDAKWESVLVLDKKGLGSWEGHDRNLNSWYCFRKEFNLKNVPSQALAKVSVDSKYWLWINGEMVVFEGGLKRGPNPYDTYCDIVDLTDYLKPGENTLAILSWYWGRNSFSHKSSGTPGLFFELPGTVISDNTWKYIKHPSYGFSEAPHPNYRLSEFNVHYDARKYSEDWVLPDFNDSEWAQVTELGIPPVAPWNNLVERPIPQWFNSGLKAYTKLERVKGSESVDTLFAYLPYNAQITPYIKLKSPAGVTIDIRMDNYIGGSEYNIRSEYITKEGEQEFESLAWMNGHVVKYAIPDKVEIIDVKYRETGFDAPVRGAFVCNDEFYNILWQKSLRTLQVCMRDNYFDCPDRERAQWWGDVVIEIGQTFYALDRNSDSLSKKAIKELVDWRKKDNTLFSPVPAGGWDSELPGQMLMSVGKYGFWNYFMHTGDTATIRYVYPMVKKYLEMWEMDSLGLIVHRTGGWDWGDWGDNIDRALLDNCYYTLGLQSGLAMAQLTGHHADISFFEDRIQSIRDGFNNHFWNGKEYRSTDYDLKTDDRGQGLAVVAGIAGPDKYEAIANFLQKRHNASPYTERYVLDAFFIMGKPDMGLERMKQRYQKMVDAPYTTLFEGWGIGAEGFGGGTTNHSWSGGPMIILSEHVAGVTPLLPGYSKFQVMPNPASLVNIDVSVPSVKGMIHVKIQNQERSFSMQLNVPNGTTCQAGIPHKTNAEFDSIEINGETCWNNGEVVGNGEKFGFDEMKRHRIFELEPGTWSIKANYK